MKGKTTAFDQHQWSEDEEWEKWKDSREEDFDSLPQKKLTALKKEYWKATFGEENLTKQKKVTKNDGKDKSRLLLMLERNSTGIFDAASGLVRRLCELKETGDEKEIYIKFCNIIMETAGMPSQSLQPSLLSTYTSLHEYAVSTIVRHHEEGKINLMSACHPKNRLSRVVRNSFYRFWFAVSYNLVLDEFESLMESISKILMIFLNQNVRNVRHMATIANNGFLTGVLWRLQEWEREIETGEEQMRQETAFAEKNKNKTHQKNISVLEQNLSQKKKIHQKVTEKFDALFKTTVVQKFYDVSDIVRTETALAVSLWTILWTEKFISSDRSRYLGFALHDTCANVRVAILNALEAAYLGEHYAHLGQVESSHANDLKKSFTYHFCERLVEMMRDVDERVQWGAVRVVRALAVRNLLSQEHAETAILTLFAECSHVGFAANHPSLLVAQSTEAYANVRDSCDLTKHQFFGDTTTGDVGGEKRDLFAVICPVSTSVAHQKVAIVREYTRLLEDAVLGVSAVLSPADFENLMKNANVKTSEQSRLHDTQLRMFAEFMETFAGDSSLLSSPSLLSAVWPRATCFLDFDAMIELLLFRGRTVANSELCDAVSFETGTLTFQAKKILMSLMASSLEFLMRLFADAEMGKRLSAYSETVRTFWTNVRLSAIKIMCRHAETLVDIFQGDGLASLKVANALRTTVSLICEEGSSDFAGEHSSKNSHQHLIGGISKILMRQANRSQNIAIAANSLCELCDYYRKSQHSPPPSTSLKDLIEDDDEEAEVRKEGEKGNFDGEQHTRNLMGELRSRVIDFSHEVLEDSKGLEFIAATIRINALLKYSANFATATVRPSKLNEAIGGVFENMTSSTLQVRAFDIKDVSVWFPLIKILQARNRDRRAIDRRVTLLTLEFLDSFLMRTVYQNLMNGTDFLSYYEEFLTTYYVPVLCLLIENEFSPIIRLRTFQCLVSVLSLDVLLTRRNLMSMDNANGRMTPNQVSIFVKYLTDMQSLCEKEILTKSKNSTSGGANDARTFHANFIRIKLSLCELQKSTPTQSPLISAESSLDEKNNLYTSVQNYMPSTANSYFPLYSLFWSSQGEEEATVSQSPSLWERYCEPQLHQIIGDDSLSQHQIFYLQCYHVSTLLSHLPLDKCLDERNPKKNHFLLSILSGFIVSFLVTLSAVITDDSSVEHAPENLALLRTLLQKLKKDNTYQILFTVLSNTIQYIYLSQLSRSQSLSTHVSVWMEYDSSPSLPHSPVSVISSADQERIRQQAMRQMRTVVQYIGIRLPETALPNFMSFIKNSLTWICEQFSSRQILIDSLSEIHGRRQVKKNDWIAFGKVVKNIFSQKNLIGETQTIKKILSVSSKAGAAKRKREEEREEGDGDAGEEGEESANKPVKRLVAVSKAKKKVRVEREEVEEEIESADVRKTVFASKSTAGKKNVSNKKETVTKKKKKEESDSESENDYGEESGSESDD